MKIALFDPGIEDNLGTPSSNLGDLIIQEAVNLELKRLFPAAEIFRISTQATIPRDYFPQLKECQHVIVGGTNLLSSFMHKYKQWQIDLPDAWRIRRAVLMGVGWWKYQKPPDWRTRLTLLSALSWRGMQSVRDEYTRSRLSSMGLSNVINTGCPTMWPFLDFDQSKVPSMKADCALLMLTDYLREPELDAGLIKLMLANYREVYFWPQGRKDLEYINEINLPVRRLEHTIGSLKEFIRTGPGFDYIGTRLHGGVHCLLQKRRSLILEVDNRAKEIAQDTGLPTAKRDDFAAIERWIREPSRLDIRMDRAAIEKWRNQFVAGTGSSGSKKAGGRRKKNEVIPRGALSSKMLNLGCGAQLHSAWVNVDIASKDERVIWHDLQTPLPFESRSFAVVYHSHVLEHLPRQKAETFLRECHRVLAPGGVLRVVVPDLESITRLYLKYLDASVAGDRQAVARHEWMTLELLDQMVREEPGGEMLKYWQRNPMPAEDFVVERTGAATLKYRAHLASKPAGERSEAKPMDAAQIASYRQSGEVHKWMYDQWSLRLLLEKCGFSQVTVCASNESQIPEFNSYQLDVTAEGVARKPDSLFMEAVRPLEVTPSTRGQSSKISQPLNIVQINTHDIHGGAARAAWRLHNELRRLGHNSAMVTRFKTSTDDDVHPIEADSDGATQASLRRWAKLAKHYIDKNRTNVTDCMFSLPVPGYDLARHPVVQAADIIHLHWVAGLLSPHAIQRLQRLGKPVVWTLHDQRAFTGGCHFSFGCRKYESTCVDCPQLGNKAPHLSSGVLVEAVELIDPASVTVATPSRWMADCARASVLLQHSPIHVIPNGVDTKLFRPMDRALARERLGIDPKGIYFLFGADSIRDRRKGIHVLLEALDLCHREESFREALKSRQINFICYGSESEKFDFGELPIRGFGRIDLEEKMALLYAAADVYICPTLEDNLPTTILEALSCGTPIVASDVGGVPDMVESHRNGLLCKPGDVEALAEAIKWIGKNQDLLPKWSVQARQGIEANFTLELQANHFNDLYSGLLKGKAIRTPLPFPPMEKMPLMPATWEMP